MRRSCARNRYSTNMALRPNLNGETGAKSVDATRFPPRGMHAYHVPHKSGVLTIERRVIMAISPQPSIKHIPNGSARVLNNEPVSAFKRSLP